MALTPKQKQYIDMNHRKMPIAHIEKNINSTEVRAYIEEMGYESYNERLSKRKWASRDTTKPDEGFFDVTQHKNWLIDDGSNYGKSW